MPHKFLFVSDTNPNDTTGGGGCVCDPQSQQDCKGPYAIFPGNDMESVVSPHVVICLSCASYAVEKMQDETQILAAGERTNEIATQRQNTVAYSGPVLPTPVAAGITEERGIDHDDDEDIPEV